MHYQISKSVEAAKLRAGLDVFVLVKRGNGCALVTRNGLQVYAVFEELWGATLHITSDERGALRIVETPQSLHAVENILIERFHCTRLWLEPLPTVPDLQWKSGY